jgi:hypothetical protein
MRPRTLALYRVFLRHKKEEPQITTADEIDEAIFIVAEDAEAAAVEAKSVAVDSGDYVETAEDLRIDSVEIVEIVDAVACGSGVRKEEIT